MERTTFITALLKFKCTLCDLDFQAHTRFSLFISLVAGGANEVFESLFLPKQMRNLRIRLLLYSASNKWLGNSHFLSLRCPRSNVRSASLKDTLSFSQSYSVFAFWTLPRGLRCTLPVLVMTLRFVVWLRAGDVLQLFLFLTFKFYDILTFLLAQGSNQQHQIYLRTMSFGPCYDVCTHFHCPISLIVTGLSFFVESIFDPKQFCSWNNHSGIVTLMYG